MSDHLFFWGHTGSGPGPWMLSQWWPAPFVVDGLRYATAEHWMMWSKAVLFGDHANADAVLASPDPARAKALGRQVSGFDSVVWAGRRYAIVVEGSVGKFSSDEALLAYLLGTGHRTLVEASPDDSVWGIGLPADDPDARRPERWRGTNLLGRALEEARRRLATA